MAKQAVAVETKPGPLQKAQDFFLEVRQELEKVTWPTVEDVKVSTRVCMYLLLAMIVVVYGFDFVFNNVVLALLKLAS